MKHFIYTMTLLFLSASAFSQEAVTDILTTSRLTSDTFDVVMIYDNQITYAQCVRPKIKVSSKLYSELEGAIFFEPVHYLKDGVRLNAKKIKAVSRRYHHLVNRKQ